MRPQGTAYYRYTLNLDEEVDRSWFLALMDDRGGTVRLNDTVVSEVSFEQPDCQVKFHRFEPAGWRSGRNVLSFSVENGGDLGGVILRGEIITKSGRIIPISSGDEGWKAASEFTEGWDNFSFDDSSWEKARSFGDARTFPWSALSNVMDYMLTDDEKAAMDRTISEASNVDFLSKEADWKARIVWHNNLA